MKGDCVMKRYAIAIAVALGPTVNYAGADVIIADPGTAVPLATPTTGSVVVPMNNAAPVSVVVLSPGEPTPQLDREGDWFVVSGPADPDRYHTILRVKDDKNGW